MKSNSTKVVLGAALMLLPACGDPGFATDEEEVDVLSEALNSSCGSFPAQYSYEGAITPSLTSSDYGSGCHNNSIIIEVQNYSNAYMPPVLAPAVVPQTQSECENTRLGFYTWYVAPDGEAFIVGAKWKYGVWTQFFGAYFCNIQLSTYPFQTGNHAKYGVTVRRYGTPVALSIVSPPKIY
jgi:hypothetical protein